MLPAYPTPPGRSVDARPLIGLVRSNLVQAPFGLSARIATLDGRVVTGGIAEVTGSSASWTATLTRLDRPGVVATVFFTEGLRDVVLCLGDGRHARARITGTSFTASAERVCRVEGIEPLAL